MSLGKVIDVRLVIEATYQRIHYRNSGSGLQLEGKGVKTMEKDLCTSGCVFWNQAEESCDISDLPDEDFFANCPVGYREEEE